MKRAWQQFVRLLGDDPELAGIGLLVAVLLVATPVVLIIYLAVGGHYAAAAGLTIGLAACVAAVGRDYRRRRWSFVSGVFVGLWILLLALWATYDLWGSSK